MSASLVGSEMCIRDSPTWRELKATTVLHPQHCARDVRTCVVVLRMRSTSVSYTHLTLPTICSV
eukprot:11112600-Alexandrium_andersonii.AAC.1